MIFLSALLVVTIIQVASAGWTCIDLNSKGLTESSDVVWLTQNCTNDPSATPLLTVNSVIVDLTSSGVRVVPASKIFCIKTL